MMSLHVICDLAPPPPIKNPGYAYASGSTFPQLHPTCRHQVQSSGHFCVCLVFCGVIRAHRLRQARTFLPEVEGRITARRQMKILFGSFKRLQIAFTLPSWLITHIH